MLSLPGFSNPSTSAKDGGKDKTVKQQSRHQYYYPKERERRTLGKPERMVSQPKDG